MDSGLVITMNKRIDRPAVAAVLALPDSYEVVISKSNYPVVDDPIIDLATVDSGTLESFLQVIDAATWEFEADALIWKIIVTAKEFDLSGSYVRDAVSTDGTLTLLTLGTPIKVRFEIPGFETANYREIDLWYDDDFNPTDLTALAEIGISLFGNGGKFTVTNAVDCKVSFKKPDSATEVYVIDYEFGTQIVPA